MYAKVMTTSDIQAHIKDIYGMDISDTTRDTKSAESSKELT